MYEEPPFQPDDTRPTMTVPAIDADDSQGGGSRVIGLISLLGALGFAAATIILLLSNNGGTPAPVQDNGQTVAEVLATETPAPTQPQTADEPEVGATSTPEIVYIPADVVPTIDGSQLVSLLSEPVQAFGGSNPYALTRDGLDPFTIIPDRPRNKVEVYVIQRGDTVSDIAQRFGLDQNSIAWSNDQRSLWTLVPGDTLLIPPVDGAAHEAVGDDTVAELAEFYGIDDPYIIIDSDFNNLKGYTPDMQLPSGLRVFIPGGRGIEIDWAPPLVQGSSTGPGGTRTASNLVSMPMGPGACAPQEPGPSSGWQRPLNGYTLTRGYADWHQGIDLAASEGAPVMAANTGRVIFAGWSTWGYGYAIVLSHGPFATLYGHLSAVNVGCGQVVGVGQVIGAVGSTGNSSGPHLHFEILYNGVRGNPAATMGF